MKKFVSDIFANAAANVLGALLVVAAAWGVHQALSQRSILKFFGVGGEAKNVVVYLSNIRVLPGGSIGPDGVKRSYQGSAIDFSEFIQAGYLQNLFKYRFHSLNFQPGLVEKFLVEDIKVDIQVSPLSQSNIAKDASLIVLGSPGYNLVADWVEKKLNPKIKFSNDYRALVVDNVPPIQEANKAFIQRLFDPSSGRPVIYAAGISEYGVTGAVYYLVQRWKELYQRFGASSPFALILKVDERNYQDAKIVFEVSQ